MIFGKNFPLKDKELVFRKNFVNHLDRVAGRGWQPAALQKTLSKYQEMPTIVPVCAEAEKMVKKAVSQ